MHDRSGFPVSPPDKPLVWLHGEIRTPPLSATGRRKAGFLLRLLQKGELLPFPYSRPMPTIGPHCHELRLSDGRAAWRIVYRIDRDAIVIADVFEKRSQSTPGRVIATCRRRLARYDALEPE